MRNTVTPPWRSVRQSPGDGEDETSTVADVTLLLVDDHPASRAVLRDVAAATPGFTVVAEAACGEDAVPAVEALGPDLVLMDVRMPGIGGCQATEIVVDRHPEVVVWLVTAQAAGALHGLAVACGAAGVLDKRDLKPRVLREIWEGRGRLSQR
jgi:two-component system, NarL family, invasion response regulator UvrY